MNTRKLSILIILTLLTTLLVGNLYGEEMESFFKTVEEPTRNNYSGVTGIEFTMNEDTHALAFGRPVTTTFEQEHTITLWQTEGQEAVAEVVVGPDSPKYEVENGTYVYEMLESSIELEEGKTYRLMSEEFSGGDNWATCYMVTTGEDITDVAAINGIPYGPVGAYPTNFDATPNKVDIGCTFFYGEPQAVVNSADKLCTTWAKLKKR